MRVVYVKGIRPGERMAEALRTACKINATEAYTQLAVTVGGNLLVTEEITAIEFVDDGLAFFCRDRSPEAKAGEQ